MAIKKKTRTQHPTTNTIHSHTRASRIVLRLTVPKYSPVGDENTNFDNIAT